MVRISLTQIGLGVVSQPVLVLIEIEWLLRVDILNTIDMAFSIRLRLKQFPTTTRDFVSTRCDVWLRHRQSRTRQDDVRLMDILHGRNTTLEVQVDIQDMALAYRCDVLTSHITLYIVILVDHGDNLLLREVEDIRTASDVQRTSFRR